MKKSEHVLNKLELKNSFMSLCNEGRKLLISDKYEDVSKSLQCFQEVLPISQELYNNQNHPNTAKVLYCIGNAYRKLGGTDNCLKALDFHQQALEMRQLYYYKDKANVEIADSLAILGETYRVLGDKVKGVEFLNQALEMRQELYPGQGDLRTIKFLLNVATAHYALGSDADLSKSLDLLEQALNMARSLEGGQPSTLTADILNNMSINYERLGDADSLNKALVCMQESLEICQKLTPHISSALATNLNNIGSLHYKLSGIDIANKQQHLEYHLQYTQKAVSINQELYGDHPHHALARSLQDLSVAYINEGGVFNMKQAYQLQKQALNIYQKLYAADHPNIIECLNNLTYIVDKNNLESYDHIIPDHYSSEAQSSNPHFMNQEHPASQNLDKDPTNLMGNMNLDKDVG